MHGPCPARPSQPRSRATRPCCASPTTRACAGCCARSRAGAGTRSERAWCLPLEAEQAEALARLLDGLPAPPDVDERLARTIERRRRRRGRRECLVDLARPDERWWLSFSTDGPPELLDRLLDHPEADRLDAIGRAHVPLDDDSAATVRSLRDAGLRLSEAASQALRQRERKDDAGRHGRRRWRATTSSSAATAAASTGS